MVLGLHSLLTPSYPPHSCQTNPQKTPIFICNFSKTSFPASCCWKIVSSAFVWHSRLSPSQTFHSSLFFPLHTGSVILGYVKTHLENSMEVQWLRLCTSTERGWSLIPSLRTKVPHAVWQKKKKKRNPSPSCPTEGPMHLPGLLAHSAMLRKAIPGSCANP